jgi:lipopolysaccharide transport system ATP-binding protein
MVGISIKAIPRKSPSMAENTSSHEDMSSDVIIQVDNLGKRYRLGQGSNSRYVALRDVLTDKAKSLFRSRHSALVARHLNNELWALRNVSFEVKRGEVIGVVGRNGAGKSTLLKILSRITEPTEGSVRLRGRVASLLEVGTGFHPELTGRENTFLNGAILGMSKTEIRKKFDEIVAFAEVEKFIDTPIKRYSSGMYVRLAFAVAAHLEPEILVVDEVLAVGDMEFQRKCLGKMHDVSTQQGRTVLFVSHNLPAVLNLCSKGLLLNQGKAVTFGPIKQVCDTYTKALQRSATLERNTGIFRSVSLIDGDGKPLASLSEGDTVRFRCSVSAPEQPCLMSLIIRDSNNYVLCELFERSFSLPRANGAETAFLVEARHLPLRPGHYSVDCWCGDRMSLQLERLESGLQFEVVGSAKTETGTRIEGPFWFPSVWKAN